MTRSGYFFGKFVQNTPDGTTDSNWIVEVQAFDNSTGWTFQRATRSSDKAIFTRIQDNGTWSDWEVLATKSDLISGAEFGGIKFYTVENNTNQIVTRKISAKNGGHLTGLLIVDYNGSAGIFAVGKIGGVKTLVGLSGFDAPSISNDVLSVQLSAWGTATLIGYGDATIS